MSNHTPGPWLYDGDYIWAESIGGYVGSSRTEDMTDGNCIAKRDAPAQIAANGLLMAAAPELLTALQWALEWIDSVPKDTVLRAMPGFDRDYVNDLIAKATGAA